MHRGRNTRRLVAAAAAGLLAAGMVTAVAAPAQATGNWRTFTAALAPQTIQAQESTEMTLTVTNTSSAVSYLDRIRLTVPGGLSVVTGSVAAPRGGWSQSLSGDVVTARTKKPLSSGLRRGEWLTLNLNVTADACEAAEANWTVRADGILFVFALQSSQPTTSIATDDCAGTGSVTEELTPGWPEELELPGVAKAVLPNGANGDVTLELTSCPDSDAPEIECALGNFISLRGDFTDGEEKLYDFASPATVLLTCPRNEAGCQFDDGGLANPLWVALEGSEGYLPYGQAGRCSLIEEDGYPTGEIRTPAAQDAGFCFDIGAVDPEADPLILPILFVEDPKFIVGR